ncbi:hypothetical protein GW17_00049926, partial [Ensete ventricosum]
APAIGATTRAGDSPLRVGRWRLPLVRPWLQPVAPLQGTLATAGRPLAGGQAVADHPYRWPSHGQLPPFLAPFTAKT